MLALALALAGVAHAADTTALAQKRWADNQSISFYCAIGRPVITSSADALFLTPQSDCTFKGPLDSTAPTRNLQPPFLNPQLTLPQLKTELQAHGVAIDAESGSQLTFHLATGERFTAQDIAAKSLEDTLMRLLQYPAGWGGTFVSINGGGLPALQRLAQTMHDSALFWTNPHVAEEQQVRPRFAGQRTYFPLPIQPKCDLSAMAGLTAPLILIGDMHTPAEPQYVLQLLKARPFAWIALEISRDHQPALDAFEAATTAADENRHLTDLLNREPSNVVAPFMDILRFAKANHMKVVLMDYHEPYFNFPYTDTSFHGAIIGTRNLLWVSQLPTSWQGTGLVFGGLAHFTDTPGADFQNFASDRFPGIQMLFINPLETCP